MSPSELKVLKTKPSYLREMLKNGELKEIEDIPVTQGSRRLMDVTTDDKDIFCVVARKFQKYSSTESVEGKKSYSCKICTKSFSTAGYLEVHHETVHNHKYSSDSGMNLEVYDRSSHQLRRVCENISGRYHSPSSNISFCFSSDLLIVLHKVTNNRELYPYNPHNPYNTTIHYIKTYNRRTFELIEMLTDASLEKPQGFVASLMDPAIVQNKVMFGTGIGNIEVMIINENLQIQHTKTITTFCDLWQGTLDRFEFHPSNTAFVRGHKFSVNPRNTLEVWDISEGTVKFSMKDMAVRFWKPDHIYIGLEYEYYPAAYQWPHFAVATSRGLKIHNLSTNSEVGLPNSKGCIKNLAISSNFLVLLDVRNTLQIWKIEDISGKRRKGEGPIRIMENKANASSAHDANRRWNETEVRSNALLHFGPREIMLYDEQRLFQLKF